MLIAGKDIFSGKRAQTACRPALTMDIPIVQKYVINKFANYKLSKNTNY